MKTITGKDNNSMMAWHYTRGYGFKKIIESGFLKCADGGISIHEKPVLWFTVNQLWEPTVNGAKLVNGGRNIKSLTMLETWESEGLYRFGVPSNQLIPWVDLVKVANIPSKVRKVLEISARKMGSNPYQWCGYMQPMEIHETVIETMADFGKWQSIGETVQ